MAWYICTVLKPESTVEFTFISGNDKPKCDEVARYPRSQAAKDSQSTTEDPVGCGEFPFSSIVVQLVLTAFVFLYRPCVR